MNLGLLETILQIIPAIPQKFPPYFR
uniref:Chaperone protein dnaJ 6-like isoform X1 n=1 Tax=Rhizophora mucronata TaxID=61149 RepID=A0A2P2LBP1_RHIMU